MNTKTMSISNAEKRLNKLLRLTMDIKQRIAIERNGLLRFHLNHAINELTIARDTAQVLRRAK